MTSTIVSVAAASSLALLAGGPAAAAPEAPGLPLAPPARTIRVTGEGRATAPPDVAVVSIGVEAFAPTVAGATGEASQKMRAVLDALGKEGLAARDIRTGRYDVSVERPWKDGKPGPVVGYHVSNTTEVRVRNLSRLGAILERVTRAGSNLIGALQLDREDPSPEQLRALRAAYASARARADALAHAAGVDLGEVLSVSEGEATMPRPVRQAVQMASAAASEVPIAEGELAYGARVEATFAIR